MNNDYFIESSSVSSASSIFNLQQQQQRVVTTTAKTQQRQFHSSTRLQKVVPFKLADIGEGIAEVEVLEWFVKEGDRVQQFDRICEVQSDKATVEITSKFDGVVTKLHWPKGAMAKVGSPLVDIDRDGDAHSGDDSRSHSSHSSTTPAPTTNATKVVASQAQTQTQQPSSSSSSQQQQRKERFEIFATPAVRRIAREQNIDLASVRGTGRDGRILKEDMLNYNAASTATTTTSTSSTNVIANNNSNNEAAESSVPLRGVAKAMVKSMTAAGVVPHLGYCDEVQMDNLMTVRSRLKPLMGDTPLSYMPFIIKATSMAMHKFPQLNVRLSQDGNELIQRRAHNIGFALASSAGLIVPNVKNVDQLSLMQIAKEVQRLIEAGRSNKLSPSDMGSGSITLSNIGTIGGTYVSPVLLLPEVVIGGFGKIQRLPRYDEHDNIVPQHIMCASWSADHRMIDGVTIASFSNLFKQYLEDPSTMLLDMK